jgi:hypothetical protein
MKKTYLTPIARAIAVKCGFRLLQQHSVRSFTREQIRYVGDADEDDEPASPSSRYVGDIDEE